MLDEAFARALEGWFLTSAERGNELTGLDRRHPGGLAWSTGNEVETLVHGASYFRRLLAAIRELGPGDHLYFTDWRGDPDQLLSDDPDSEVGTVLAAAAGRGVIVKGLLWRSHMDRLGFSAKENRHLGVQVNSAGGEVLLDQGVGLGRLPPSEAHRDPPPGKERSRCCFRGRHRPLPQPARRRRPSRRPAAAGHGAGVWRKTSLA